MESQEYPNLFKNNNLNNSKNNFLDKLLKIPLENLGERIKELEDEIRERIDLKARIIADLEQEEINLQNKIYKLPDFKYALEPDSIFISRKTTLELQMLNAERIKMQEEVACFRDLVILKEKLRFAKEELKKQKCKSDLLLNERNKEVVKKTETGFR